MPSVFKKTYKKIGETLSGNKLLRYGAIALGVVLLVVLYSTFRGGNGEVETIVVERGEFLQQVSVSGKVEAAQDVDLSFSVSDRIASIRVEVGDEVSAGDALASLNLGTLSADLRSAQAELALRRAQQNSSVVSVDRVREEQDQLVASAYRKMLSSGLEVRPNSSSYTATTPTITGLYDGPEGTYKLRIERQADDNYELRVFDLESVAPVQISETGAIPLGTRGLYITFPDDPQAYSNTTWWVDVPNTKSSVYLANYNAYQEALRARDRAISDAQSQLQQSVGGTTVLDAQIQQAQAEVSRIATLIAERTLRAPFSGIVTAVPIKVGSIAATNEPAVSLISADILQIESFVPEINLSLLEVGDPAEVTLDAYGESVPFPATIVSIDPAETVRDGVSTYRALLQFTEQDERIRAGMTANVVITTDRRDGVIAVPQGVVKRENGRSVVRVQQGEKIVEREVITGAVSSSAGSIEILSGLEEGEMVVLTEGS